MTAPSVTTAHPKRGFEMYINRYQNGKTETIDHESDHAQARRLIAEYRLSDRNAFWRLSQRPSECWFNSVNQPRGVRAVYRFRDTFTVLLSPIAGTNYHKAITATVHGHSSTAQVQKGGHLGQRIRWDDMSNAAQDAALQELKK